MILNDNWQIFLDNELQQNYFIKLQKFIDIEYKSKTIFPKYENLFKAFNLLMPEDVKVIILGQDPYHGANQANGLAFSVLDKVKIPPSLKNIFNELNDDIGCSIPNNGDLTLWAYNGVLLINSVLSVEESKPNSHRNKGWERFTDSVIYQLSQKFDNLVFILWGNPSQKKESLIDVKRHLILKAPHPSPLSSYRGFFGSKPFSQTNTYLKQYCKKEIDWCLN